MIAVPTGVRVWIAAGHTDMRRGMQSLALQVQEGLKRDPLQFEERTLVFAVLVAAARSMSRSHRLQCLTGRFDPGASYKQAWAL
jgi:transposase